MTQSNFSKRIATIQANQARLIAQGGSAKDTAQMLDPANKYGFTEAVSLFIDKHCDAKKVDSLIFTDTVNPKIPKRFAQFMGAVYRKDYSLIDYTHARALWALHLSGAFGLTTDALRLLTSNTRGDANTRGIGLSVINKHFEMSHDCVDAKLSNSLGKPGFMRAAGLVDSDTSQNHNSKVNTAHPVVKMFIEMIESGNRGQIESIKAPKKGAK